MPNDQQLSAKTKMVTDYLMLAQSLHQAADSMNAYVAVLASTSTHSDTVSLLIPPPQLPPLAPYDGPGGARIPLPNLANNRGHTESDEEAAGDGKKRRRVTKEKKPKDPNAPKRPASGYLVYQNSVRAQVKADNPDMPHKDVQAKIAADWNTMDADKKKIYNDEASAALADWKSKTADYEKTKGDNPAEVKPVSKPASKAAAKKKAASPGPILPNIEPSTEGEDETGEDESEEETAAQVVPKSGNKKQAADTSEDEEESDDEQPPAKKNKKAAASPPKSLGKKAAAKPEKSAEKKTKKNKA